MIVEAPLMRQVGFTNILSCDKMSLLSRGESRGHNVGPLQWVKEEGSRRRQLGAKGREREREREREFEASGRFGPRWDMSRAGEASVTFGAGVQIIIS